jgi:hypothetical protein
MLLAMENGELNRKGHKSAKAKDGRRREVATAFT